MYNHEIKHFDRTTTNRKNTVQQLIEKHYVYVELWFTNKPVRNKTF